jgi:hypothetical protein
MTETKIEGWSSRHGCHQSGARGAAGPSGSAAMNGAIQRPRSSAARRGRGPCRRNGAQVA